MMLEFITDQRQLLKLALGLRVDLDYLIRAIRSNTKQTNKEANSEFLEGLFIFLTEVIGLERIQGHPLSLDTNRRGLLPLG